MPVVYSTFVYYSGIDSDLNWMLMIGISLTSFKCVLTSNR